ncbi:MAG: hypothetical protein KAY27_01480, partial [Pedobacter sp.]|nr:hypothetical protein [Pedobacter sp.]
MLESQYKPTTLQKIFRILLGLFLIIAAIGHLTLKRQEFQALVPNWVPIEKDLVVILSGLVEGAFGLAVIFWKKQHIKIVLALAIFFVLVFPGNVAQYLNH